MDMEINYSYSDVTKTFLTTFEKTVLNVLEKYNDLLELLAEIIAESSDARKIAKFWEIQQDMFEFLKVHKHLFKIEKISIKASGNKLFNVDISDYSTAKELLDYNFFLLLHRKKIGQWEAGEMIVITTKFCESDIVAFIESLFKKPMSELNAESVSSLEDLWHVTDVKWKNTICSVEDLSKKLTRRFEDFQNDMISNKRTEELSFTLDGATTHLVTDSQCSVCIEEFEKNQALCRMPCGHCFHKQCIENWVSK